MHTKHQNKALIILSIIICSGISLSSSAQKLSNWKDALYQADGWYATNEATQVADNLLLYQSELGGWAKDINMATPITKEKIEKQKKKNTNQINETTIDRGASCSQIEFLARVFNATGLKQYKKACLKGINFLLEAQYENGGWAQFYPLKEGYHKHITFNDGAMIGVLNFLHRVAIGEFNFIDSKTRQRCAKAVDKGINAILQCQIVVDGTPTVWCAQHDETTFQPTEARVYEHPSLDGFESVAIVEFLLTVDNPSPELIQSVKNAVAWFEASRISGIRLVQINNPESESGFDYVVGFDPSSMQSMWARFYEIETNYPIFVNYDGTTHYSIGEIEIERRTNFAWFGYWAEKLLTEDYPAWCEKQSPLQLPQGGKVKALD
ncbi:MAG: pectate lyase [Mangrovibacterium sp.]